MGDYEKPIITILENAEGVFTSSGSNCFLVNCNIHQIPQNGRGDYRIQVTAQHNVAGHPCNTQYLELVFNIPVVFKECTVAKLLSGNNTSSLTFERNSWCNGGDESIGFGDIVLEAEPGLTIVSSNVWDNY